MVAPSTLGRGWENFLRVNWALVNGITAGCGGYTLWLWIGGIFAAAASLRPPVSA